MLVKAILRTALLKCLLLQAAIATSRHFTSETNQTRKPLSSGVDAWFCGEPSNKNDKQLVTLPSVALKALGEANEVNLPTLSNNATAVESGSKLFQAVAVHLSNSRDQFFFVQGQPPFTGVDNSWFWIVRVAAGHASVLLFVHTNCLEIRHSSTSGLRDIRTEWASAQEVVTETYTFNGLVYELRSTRHKHR